ncbi:galactose oxidase early set domain-containing protein [Kitasatospora sp. NBC_00240]|uniref:galactose oxidase early set domain-containing protein n=1 Tax=Kitasatospora sp. NBC_00240 TaxID=2903567 RepID=UPI00224E3578|nr:galactose oxidase early set domain-containing protein [Kitasatospora sp. NBC_00240]MCX5213111.1 galactose oxidase early set domain-containing protein [Kitasatospora sp. NBC_00240]
MSRRKLSAALSACAVVSALTGATLMTTAAPALARAAQVHGHDDHPAGQEAGPHITSPRVMAEMRPDEVASLGQEHAEAHASARAAIRGVGDYPQPTRTNRLNALTDSQAKINAGFDPATSGAFKQYFPSPEFAAHIAMLPTGKVLLFSFERIETNPEKEPAPTQTTGKENAGRAFLWDPAKGTGPDAFTKVTPPVIDMPDGLGEPRPAPFFCAGHSFLPNGMLGVFGGNLGGNGGSGAKLSLIFDPWTETWTRNPDMSVGRWYPSVVTGADGRQLIMSGQSELGWGTPTPVVERFPAKDFPVPQTKSDLPRDTPVDTFRASAPFTLDYPHLFSMRDGNIYGFGRHPGEQWLFDPNNETRSDLPARPDGKKRNYGSAVPLPGGTEGPDATLLLGGDRDNPNTLKFANGAWTAEKSRAFGRTQDDTLLLPDGTLMTVNGAYDIRDYGNGPYNPNADLKYRQTELRDAQGNWRLGPVQRLPRGYHSNAVVLPDGRVMVTGDELQQLANDPDITDDMNGTIEIYEPAYLAQGARPALDRVPQSMIGFGSRFLVNTSTPTRAARAVLLSPTTATHSVNTSQRHVELRITSRAGTKLELQAPPSAAAAPPGYYMLFLLDDKGVPSTAQWVQVGTPS